MASKHQRESDTPQFDMLTIKIASDDVIRNEWSRGEIKKPETINYRAFKPEKSGLFCEKIFGPQKDWECACGKYKKIKHKGIVCDRCGVEVTTASVRRERMAHIDLAVPVVHIWFFKTMPSRIGNVLGMTSADLERVIYYEEYVVIEPGQTELQKKQLLNDVEYREAQEKWGKDAFIAKMGGEAVKELLVTEDLQALLIDLKDKLRRTKSQQARIKLAKRLKIVESFHQSGNSQAWMVMSAVPVIPPELRPLVPLDGGRFATSDLNDLYRRVINRNNRLKAILKLKTPEVIVRNEKRMLQESVDALFDNGRHGHPVMGAGNRPLKSLSDMLKGKGGRFRQNLLGKRVDYSGRSVIIVGPELKFNQCGLPKVMALELFEPFIVKRLKDLGYVYTIRSAKKMIQRQAPEVWDVLEEIIKGHPVLLNRAPTLHRLGIQAFEPTLIEGKAIRIHPLVCAAFNADFDGDQMAVYVPLSIEAQIEAKLLMMAPDNIFLPSSGKPVAIPSQDMTLGLYYLMHDPIYIREENGGKTRIFSNQEEVLLALGCGSYNWYEKKTLPKQGERFDHTGRGLRLHEKIKVRTPNGIIETTPGRVVFNTIVPETLGFQNYSLPKKRMGELILECYKKVGLERTVRFLDDLKNLGFREATKAALSLGVCDVKIPPEKQKLLDEAHAKVSQVLQQYEDGVITDGERRSKVISIWTEASEALAEVMFTMVSEIEGYRLNPLYAAVDSGARGSKSQVKQIGAMRGLMARPSGEIIESPITSNFREGLTVAEYFISTHGARKGLADTALKTADSGYLTRRLVDVAQDVIIVEEDCMTLNGIDVSAIKQGQEELLPLKDRIFGRTVCDDIYMPGDSTKLLAKKGDTLNMLQAEAIDDAGLESVKIRSVMTCETPRGVCAACYGVNLANGKKVSQGEAVGIIAAQSIGEPGTQLTMRTFHLGGIAAASVTPEIVAEEGGILVYRDLRIVETDEGVWIALNKNGSLDIVVDEGRPLEEVKKLLSTKSIEPLQTFAVDLGTKILVGDGAKIKKGQKVAEWEQHNIPIICDRPGYAKYEDLVEGISTEKDINKQTGQTEIIIKQHRGELHPQIAIYADKKGKELVGTYHLPAGAIISIDEDSYAKAGTLLARLPRGAIKTKDITGGLPRVAELFEARKPKDAAVIAIIDGFVEIGSHKGKRIVSVKDPVTGAQEEHLIPHNKHLIVQRGDHVVKGQQLTDGLVIPHEILEVCGVRELQKYVVNQVQEVYRLQGVDINDKHVEIIVRQMLKKVRIVDPGDTSFLFGEEVERKAFQKENDKMEKEGSKAAQGAPVLLGITKASLSTDSFISAASFQDTTRVLTEAAFAGKVDDLRGFKENVIMGHIIPGGTGFEYHKRVSKFVDTIHEEELVFDFISVL